MAHFHDSALIGASGQGGYQIERSLRFNSADSAYCSRVPASAGNRRTFTWSGWFKVGNHSSSGEYYLLCTNGTADNTFFYIQIRNNQLRLGSYNSGSFGLFSTQLFRDPSAWYHLVVAVDTTQATAANRAKAYVNGTEITTWSTANYPSQNYDLGANDARAHAVGAGYASGSPYAYWDGLLTECYLIDGQALTPSSFGETDTITGVWKPKKYTGTYSGNSFYLKFADNSGTTSTTLGKDSSGLGNHFTPNNFSVTAGAGNDSLIDTPTPYADGGNGRGNYCTLNPLDVGSTSIALSNGNLDFTKSGANFSPSRGTLGVTAGKWYFEMTANNTNLTQVGVSNDFNIRASSGNVSVNNGIGAAWDSRGFLYQTGSSGSYGYTFTTNDVVMIAFDVASGKIWFGKNGTWNTGDPAAGTSPAFTASGYSALFPFVNGESGGGGTCNFGQRAFAYTPPSGFKALNTQNLPEPSIKKPSSYMDTLLYTGNGSARSITGLGFSPDFVWTKVRSSANDHKLYDAVRGATKVLESSNTGTEGTDTQGLTAFNSDGFSLGTASSSNANGSTYVAWCWDESATPGFDIVTYTGNGTNRTIAHSLGVAPSMIIFKNRNVGTTDWAVYFKSLVEANSANYVKLNSTDAVQTSPSPWNGTLATSSVFSVGTWDSVNGNGNGMVAYLWSEVAGFSKFGSYVSNGSSDGPFVYCGFRPRWILVKATSNIGAEWILWDTARTTYNLSGTVLSPTTAGGDSVDPTYRGIDIVSNGFKIRCGAGNNPVNNSYSNDTYIFAAFAESPFKYSLAR